AVPALAAGNTRLRAGVAVHELGAARAAVTAAAAIAAFAAGTAGATRAAAGDQLVDVRRAVRDVQGEVGAGVRPLTVAAARAVAASPVAFRAFAAVFVPAGLAPQAGVSRVSPEAGPTGCAGTPVRCAGVDGDHVLDGGPVRAGLRHRIEGKLVPLGFDAEVA